MAIVNGDYGLVAEEFCGFLDSLKDKSICFSEKGEDYRPSYICTPEPLYGEEWVKYPAGCKCVCFRVVGYTVGHLIVDAQRVIKDIIVYDRDEASIFSLPCKELENSLKKQFIDKPLN